MAESILITGASSGIGLALARASLARGDRVLALQRRSSPLAGQPHFFEVPFDLRRHEDGLPEAVTQLVGTLQQSTDSPRLDKVILNAGLLGSIQDLDETSLSELRDLMNVNLWANKSLLDALFHSGCEVTQVVGISSGAAVSGSRGWGGYALSKAALVMLLKLYAAERPETHFASFAPGLVDTGMQDYLCGLTDDKAKQFPSLARIQSARGTDIMPRPEAAAGRFLSAFDALLDEPSGAFIDIRKWDRAPADS